MAFRLNVKNTNIKEKLKTHSIIKQQKIPTVTIKHIRTVSIETNIRIKRNHVKGF